MTTTPPEDAQPLEPTSPNKMVEGLHKELECVICNAVMIDPRVLDCQHAMCLRCIFGIVKRDRGNGVTIVCPFHCEERTRTKSDVRSLKRNPMIGNLCVSVRERDYKNKIHDCCDWCDKALWEKAETSAEAEPVFCSRCGAISCQTCAHDRRCDHAYLCGGLKVDGAAGIPVRVLPMLMSADMCLGEVVKDFGTRVSAGCSTLDRKTFEQLELNMGLAPSAPDVAYVIGTQVDVDVEAGGKSGVFTVTLLPADEISANRDLERHMVCHSCVTPSDLSPEVTNLNEVSSATEALSLRIATIRRCAGALARAIGRRGAGRAVTRATLAIAQGADAVLSVVRATTLKRLRRLILVSHLLNIPHIEKLAERTTHAPDETAKESMHRSLITQVKLALSLSNRVYASLDALIEEVEACTAESSDLVLRCIEMLREEAPPARAASMDTHDADVEALAQLQGISAVQSTIESCSRDVLNVDARLGAYVGLLFDSLMGEVPMEGEQRLSFEDLTAKVKQSSGHVRIVASTWTTVASIAASIDCLPPDVAVEPLSIPDPMTEEQETVLAGVDELVDSLCPQIFDFRRQHFEMMESSPEQTHANRQVLLDQLSSLILQALDLFFKEELMRSQAQASLFSRVRAFERAVEEKSAALHRMLEPESAAADDALLETIRESGFTTTAVDDGSAIVCARSASFAANNVPPRRIGLDEAAAITKAALCFAGEDGEEPRRVQNVTASEKGAQALVGRVITSSITQHGVPVSPSTPSFVLCDDLRARAQRLAKRAFSSIHPKEKNVKAQIVSMNAASVILVPVVYDSLRLTHRAPGIVDLVTRPLRARLGLSVLPEFRKPAAEAVGPPADDADPAASPATETGATDGANSVSVQTAPPSVAKHTGLLWKRVGPATLWHVRYIVDAASGTIVQEPLPSIPVYDAVDRMVKLLQRPIVFAGIASAITATAVTLRVGIWAVRAGNALIEAVKASNSGGGLA